MDRPSSPLPRRRFLHLTGAALGLAATSACATAARTRSAGAGRLPVGATIDRTYTPRRFDPWIELDRAAWTHNVREAARLASGRPILAVVKNNAYGLGDRAVGPLLAEMPEVGGIASVRVEEALAMREEGVTKPIVVMAEGSEDEIEELARHDVLPVRLAGRCARAAAERVQATGPSRTRPALHRHGDEPRGNALHTRAPLDRGARAKRIRRRERHLHHVHARPGLRPGAARPLRGAPRLGARGRNLPLGTLHASPTFELFHLPEAHYDMVRPGNALFGNHPAAAKAPGTWPTSGPCSA